MVNLVNPHPVIPVATDDPLLPQAEKQTENGAEGSVGAREVEGVSSPRVSVLP